MTKTVKWLIVINAAVFFIINIFPELIGFFGLVPVLTVNKLMVWQIFTYMFMHKYLTHILVNMLSLWFFGPAIEIAWGKKKFLAYYIFTGVGAGLCSLVTALGSSVPVIGASGAIYGILVAYAVLFPETVILVFFFFPMKIKYALLFLVGVNLTSALTNQGGTIAYFAHLGGALFGYLYLKNEWIYFRLQRLAGFNFKGWWKRKLPERRKAKQDNLDSQVDEVLDKINRYGVGSLTTREREILDRKRKNM